MEGLVLLLIILMYTELSLCPLTRAIARVIFYTHTLAIIGPMYMPTASLSILLAMGIYLVGFCCCADISNTIRGKILFFILAALTTYFYICIFSREILVLLVEGVPIAEYSDTIFRWAIIGAIGMCSQVVEKDPKLQVRDLQLGVCSLWGMSIA